MANRIDRINEEARKEISSIIRELKDPRVTKGLCSVVAVDITKDLRWCKAYISVFGDEAAQKDVEKDRIGEIRRLFQAFIEENS